MTEAESKKQEVAQKMGKFFNKEGTTSKFGSKHHLFDQLTYKPFKGAHRGYVYRIPIVGKKILRKDMAKAEL